MHVHFVPLDDILVKTNRQRRTFDQSKILELAGSIAENGLLHPVVLRKEDGEYCLVVGERRLKAIEHLHFMSMEFNCGGQQVPKDRAPALFLGEIDPVDAEEMELEENIRREDLSWQERADAVSRLARLRATQAQKNGTPAPTIAKIAEEVAGNSEGQHQENVRQDIILGRALQNPKTAAVIQAATSRKDAFKLLKRHEEQQKNAELGRTIGASFNSSMHTLRRGDCLQIMSEMPEATFDVILTDPPYGISADEFSDSGGKTAGGHFYDDSYETWSPLIRAFADHSFRLAKQAAHLYIFCDIDRFLELKEITGRAGWEVFRTPLVWFNPGGMRAPWPEHGPQRKTQYILFAIKGKRPVTRLYGDLLTHGAETNLGHPAQKPVALYSDLLLRSVKPGDSVLDPFAGSGPIFPAAHAHKCRATGLEQDEAAFGIAAKRLEALK